MEDSPVQNVPARAPLPEADAQLYLHPQTLARLSTMELRAKMIVEGVMSGQHRSPHHGFSVEFAQHRAYVPGDDIRHLDWKVFGRTDKLHLKQFQQETNLDVVLMVDSSGSMSYGSRLFSEASGTGQKTNPRGRPNWTKYDHSTALAAAISYITLRQGDRVGLSVFAGELRNLVRRSSSSGVWRQIVGALSVQPVNELTDLGRCADQVLAKTTNRCLFVLISDFFMEPEIVRATLARMRHKKHDVVLFQVLDRTELTFDFTDAAPFQGLENDGIVRVDPRAVRQAYREAINAHNAAIERTCRAFNFDYHRVLTHDWLGPPLAAYLARRNAQIKRSKAG
ncbi:MAG: DUF58 domain-containing protein [Phycisphaerales bacterium]|jgi:uncharacterized protein (DUF58 family)|nr:DUF58 domain-containing protein [Phycisphaerales bacterium]